MTGWRPYLSRPPPTQQRTIRTLPVRPVVSKYPKMWISGYFIRLVELFYGISVPPSGCQTPGKHRSCSHNPHFQPAGGLTVYRLRFG